MNIIYFNLKKILDYCRIYKVKTLSVFGSILTERFNDKSDIDLLVDFEPQNPETFDYATNYFNLKEELENLLKRKVDLIEYGDNLNPLFREAVDKNKIVIYG